MVGREQHMVRARPCRPTMCVPEDPPQSLEVTHRRMPSRISTCLDCGENAGGRQRCFAVSRNHFIYVATACTRSLRQAVPPPIPT